MKTQIPERHIASIRHDDATNGDLNASLYWYSRGSAVAFTLLLLLVAKSISFLIPPFQSSDEPTHLKRAYLLSNFEIFLSSKDGGTGGAIDAGLLQYMRTFEPMRFNYDRKYTTSLADSSATLKWSDESHFSRCANTASYFPILYSPQAAAITIGRSIQLGVPETYYLARSFSLIATAGLILAALLIYPTPPIVLAILFLPMTLFQLGSASQDAVSFGTATLVGALLMRAADHRFSFSTAMFVCMELCLFALATSRIAFVALALSPLALPRVRQSRAHVLTSVVVVGLALGWILYAMMTIEGATVRPTSSIEIISYYFQRPLELSSLLVRTMTDADTLALYWRTFVGVLGWTDTPLGSEIYIGTGITFVSFIALGVAGHLFNRGPQIPASSRLWLAMGVAASVFLMYLALLVTINPINARTIDGVVGRYFIPMIIVLGYIVFDRRPRWAGTRIEQTLVVLVIGVSAMETTTRLLHRYWMA